MGVNARQERSKTMDVFQLRNDIISDYASYVDSFIHIRDERVREHVSQELQEGLLWPPAPTVELQL